MFRGNSPVCYCFRCKDTSFLCNTNFLLLFSKFFFVFAVSVYSDADFISIVHLCTEYNNILLFIFLCYIVFVHPRNSCPVWLFPFWKVRMLFSPDLLYIPFSLFTRATYRGIHRQGHSGANRGIWGHFKFPNY